MKSPIVPAVAIKFGKSAVLFEKGGGRERSAVASLQPFVAMPGGPHANPRHGSGGPGEGIHTAEDTYINRGCVLCVPAIIGVILILNAPNAYNSLKDSRAARRTDSLGVLPIARIALKTSVLPTFLSASEQSATTC